MYTCSVIPDDCSNFFTFINELAIDDIHKNILQSSTIVKININTDKAVWELIIRVVKNIPSPICNILEQEIAKRCFLKKVKITLITADILSYFKNNWLEFLNEVTKNNPGIKPVLSSAKKEIIDNVIIFKVTNSLAAQMLKTRNIDKNISDYIMDKLGLNYQIRFVFDRAASVATTKEDYFTPAYIEALSNHNNFAEATQAVNPVLYGRKIKENAIAISSIQEECRNIVVAGEIISCDIRELRSGRILLSIELVDATDGIAVKLFFENKDEASKVEGKIKTNINVKVKGTVQFDKFSNELILYPASILLEAENEQRIDKCGVKRIELHAHTKMSNMDAVVSAKELIKTAAKWGHKAIAITDHGVVQAFPEAAEEAKKRGIKVIYGIEGYLVQEELNSAYHIILLAKNLIGLRNLYRLVSVSHLKYLHRTPRIPRRILEEYREGLIVGSACEAGELIQAIINGVQGEQLKQIAAFYDYLEIQPIGNNAFLVREGLISDDSGLQSINVKVYELGKKLNKPVVATGDVHFLNPEDEVYRRILMTGKGYSDADNQPPLYFRTTQEMLDEFAYLGKAAAQEVVVESPHLINEMIEKIKPIPDELYSPQIPGAEEEIKQMSYQKAESLYGKPLPEIVETRLKYELDSIINNGFAVLYLIAHKLVKKSLDDGYLVGSRGSVGSSFVATMTDITEVNPLPPHWLCPNCKVNEFIADGTYGSGFDMPEKECPKCSEKLIRDGHDIPFAVFMGFHGDKVPDIDLNFSGDYQPAAHKYTEELFGKDNVFRAGTIATIADKTAFGYVKNYFKDKAINVRNAYLNKLVSGCTGVKRTTGQHPGGIMVVPRDMDVHHFTPIQYPAGDKNSATITTHFDYHSISSRLVKLDILGHDDPTVIKMLEKLTGIDAKTIPFNDEKTLSLFSTTTAINLTSDAIGSTVATFAIPEFGTKFVRQMLEDTRPKKFSELVRISGFSHGTDVWLNNAQELIKSGKAKLGEAISTRDDIMVYLIQKGVESQLAFKIMESVRKGKGIKNDDVSKIKKNKVPDWYVESCQKIKYMFPKAHAVAYVMMAFRIAYFKVYYPLAFYAAYFTVRATEFDAELVIKEKQAIKNLLNEYEQKGNALTAKEKGLQTIAEVVLEMYLRGFHFEKVDLYKSAATTFIIIENGLLPPLVSLQGLGGTAAQNIVQAREERPFSSIEDIKNRARVSKIVIEILREHGCLDGLCETDQLMLFA